MNGGSNLLPADTLSLEPTTTGAIYAKISRWLAVAGSKPPPGLVLCYHSMTCSKTLPIWVHVHLVINVIGVIGT